MKEFNSQICTTREQSERLLALGIKPETADMWYVWDFVVKDYNGYGIVQDYFIPCEEDIPAWSLYRLVSTLTNNGIIITFIDNIVIIEQYKTFQKSYEFWDDVYDNIIDCIEWLIKEGYFNKEYLV